MENGFARLIASLEALTQSFNNLNIPQIQEDMTVVIEGVEDIAIGLTNYLEAMEDYNSSIAVYNEAVNEYNDALLAAGEAYNTALVEFENVGAAVEALENSNGRFKIIS